MLGGCANLPCGAPRLPQPAADLMQPGPDWIGIIGSCVGRYEQLGKMVLGGQTR